MTISSPDKGLGMDIGDIQPVMPAEEGMEEMLDEDLQNDGVIGGRRRPRTGSESSPDYWHRSRRGFSR